MKPTILGAAARIRNSNEMRNWTGTKAPSSTAVGDLLSVQSGHTLPGAQAALRGRVGRDGMTRSNKGLRGTRQVVTAVHAVRFFLALRQVNFRISSASVMALVEQAQAVGGRPTAQAARPIRGVQPGYAGRFPARPRPARPLAKPRLP